MKLDRNIPPYNGKYALVKLRVSGPIGVITEDGKDCVVIPNEAIDYGGTPDTDFFVIRLKDKYAFAALKAYATAAEKDGEVEYATEVIELAIKAERHPFKHKPD